MFLLKAGEYFDNNALEELQNNLENSNYFESVAKLKLN